MSRSSIQRSRNLEGPNDPKIRFYRTIKELEARLGDPNVILNSFIIANTPFQQVRWWTDDLSKDQFTRCHVLFQKDDRDTYIQRLLTDDLQIHRLQLSHLQLSSESLYDASERQRWAWFLRDGDKLTTAKINQLFSAGGLTLISQIVTVWGGTASPCRDVSAFYCG